MNRLILLLALVAVMSCKKNEEKPAPINTNKQFHKSIAIGENYYQNPEILYSFLNKNNSLDLVYDESDQLKWVQLDSNKAVFKKILQPTGSFKGFWSKGFAQKTNGDYIITGAYWRGEGHLGSAYITTASSDGSVLSSKIISYKSVEHLSADVIYASKDGGYFLSIIRNNSFDIMRLNENADVNWRLMDLQIKNTGVVKDIKGLVEDSNGNIFIMAMFADQVGGTQQECLIKIGADGKLIWLKAFDIRNLEVPNSVPGRKRMVIDENDNIYAFEESHFYYNKLVTKFDRDGNIVMIKKFGNNTMGLYDMQYINQSFFVLIGGETPTKTLHLQLDKNLEIVKKGVVLSAGDLAELPGKFFKSANNQTTDFILAGKDMADNNAWQYVRLDNNWKYPCYDYKMPDIIFKNHNDFTVRSWGHEDVDFFRHEADEFITTEESFELKSQPISNMTKSIFCPEK